MTYGWMLLVVAIVGGAIFSVVQSQSVESVSGFTGGDVVVDDFGITSDDELQLVLRNADSNSVTVEEVRVSDESNTAEWIDEESIGVADTGTVTLREVGEGSGADTLDVEVIYSSGGLSNLQVQGSISGNFEVIEDSTVLPPVSAENGPSFSTSTGDEDVWVPVSADSGTENGFDYFFDEASDEEYFSEEEGFYVMKYEAKAYNESDDNFVSDGTTGSGDWADESVEPRSVAANKPWREMSFNENDPDNGYGAVQACEALNDDPDIGDDYEFGLVTNREWMTVARQVEQTDSNWVDGEVDSDGQLIRGHSNDDPSDAIAATTDDSDGFYNINGAEDRNERTFELANGEVVWDWSGNVRQWTYAEDSGGSTTNGVFDETDPDGKEYEKDPEVVDRSTAGVGSDLGFDEDSAALRGGTWSLGDGAGVFGATSNFPANSYTDVGFRCSAVPVS